MTNDFLKSLRLLAPTLLCAGLSLHAATPQPLSPQELQQRQQWLQDSMPQRMAADAKAGLNPQRQQWLQPFDATARLQKQAAAQMQANAELDESCNTQVNSFLQANDCQGFMIKASAANPAAAEHAGATEKAAATPAAAGQQQNKDSKPMVIECQDGLYFDAAQGLLVYLKDVRLRDERFSMDCDNNLKVYMQRDEAKAKKKQQNAEKAQAAPGEPGSELSLLQGGNIDLNFSGVQRIVASGNVRLQGKDKSGKTMRAGAETATYSVKNKDAEVILSGGKPYIEDGNNRIDVSGDGCYIRVYGDGSVFIKGNRVVTAIDNIKNQQKPGQ